MNPVAISFGVATAAVVIWCFLGGCRDRWVAAAASVVMATGWAACRAAEKWAGWDVAPDAYALVDLFSAFAMSMLWARSERRFLIPLALIFTAQSGLHLFYQTEGRYPGGIYPYLFALDVLYGVGLIVLAFGGRLAADVLLAASRDLFCWLRSRYRDNCSASPKGSGAGSCAYSSRPVGPSVRLGRSLPAADSFVHFSQPSSRRDRGL